MLSELRKRITRILLLIVLISGLTLPPSVLGEEVLKMGGTGCALGTMDLVGRAFQKSHPGIKVVVITQSLGSSGGIKAVSKGAIDIGLSARALKDEEIKLGLSLIEYARTPFILVTKKDVNISGLNTEETVRIFRGDTKTWPDGKRVRLIVRPSTEMDTMLVKQISPEMSKAVDIALSNKGFLMAMTDQNCLDLIEKTPGGLGFAALTQVLSEKRQLKVLLFNGLTPSSKALADGSYPFYKTLYFVTKTEPSVWVRKFIDFIRSPEGRKVLEETGNLVTIDRSGR
jgi:phosphate transport system substrate-binding protein